MAQRDFETAVDLIAEGRDHLQDCPDTTLVQEVREKLLQRETFLVDTLSKELKSAGEQSQGGPKAARRAIKFLVKLGKASKVR